MKHVPPLLLLSVMLLSGCESSLPVYVLPDYVWRGNSQALDDLQVRSARLHSASGSATMTLRRADGASVQVDSAFAMRQADALRIRAWKMNRAVADWTLRSDGVWVWQAESADKSPPSDAAGPWTARHTEIWPLLFGMVQRRADDEIADGDGGDLILRRKVGGVTVVIFIQRRTLVVRECQILREDGTTLQSVMLGHYQPMDGIYWPMQVIAQGEAGAFELRFGEVTINEELADTAFTPPARARRLD